jgi:plastocyanin
MLLAVAGLVLGLAACSSSSKSSGSGSSGPAGTIVIQNTSFTTPDVSVKAGAKVTVDNKDGFSHTVTSDEAGKFDTGTIDGNKTVTFTAPTTPGTYKFHCNIHSTMHGTLTVT